MQQLAFTLLIVLLYLAAATGFSLQVLRAEMGARNLRPLVIGAGSLAILGHAFLLYSQTISGPGVNLSFFNAGSLMGWVMAAMVMLAAIRLPLNNLAVAILPIGALTLLLSMIMGPADTGPSTIPAGLEIHILSSVLAYSVLGIAVLQALVLAYQHNQLRNRRPTGVVRALPPLQTMEDLLFQMLWVGFALLTLSLLSGWIFLEDIFAQHLVHKTTLSVVAWIVFATLLGGRLRYGWRGRTAVRWTLGGYAALMLAYFGTKLVLELILQR
ncbi:ABC-type uncharacterized transport system permease subunit [Natronocella acetinitrilica]|uniref:ABC-type uncharacterized transport system permease subunit n=1 Tax=Natronocella acetinitrilica TaxID=414046 RepID=A0AAE3KHU9_9GAMM|nr:cytochrome c biogenesis protein CcsA [Natronocella acetinitrilica]MCP1676717.1 ABC-type uncharacterized transport system permease subunit [Natronocella acetinitrilica]